MRNDFYQTYEARMNEKYRTHIERKYYPFIELILRELPLGACSVGEFGCGAANISRVLAKAKPEIDHILVDIDQRMLALAGKNMDLTSSRFELIPWNILSPLPHLRLQLVHSHGVLEHFSDRDIRQILDCQKLITHTLIHYVPSHKYEKPSFGDERLLTPEQWKKICNPDQILEFNDGFDLALIWRK